MAAGDIGVTGKIGKALDFDGSDDYVLFNNTILFNVPSGGSMSCFMWVKTTENEGVIFSLRNDLDADPVFDLAIGNNGVSVGNGEFAPLMRFDDGTGLVNNDTNTTINDGVWHFIGAVYDTVNDEFVAYIDTSKFTASQATNGSMTFANQHSIGAEKRWIDDSAGSADQRYFDGQIDDVRIYNRALSATEIQALYQLGQ